MSKHTPMVVAAARELCARASEECGVDKDDNWKVYGETFLMDAKAAIDAAGAPEILEALQRLIAAHDAHSTLHAEDGDDVARMIEWAAAEDAARSAIAKAEGKS